MTQDPTPLFAKLQRPETTEDCPFGQWGLLVFHEGTGAERGIPVISRGSRKGGNPSLVEQKHPRVFKETWQWSSTLADHLVAT